MAPSVYDLNIPAHQIYSQQRILSSRETPFSPIYLTPKGTAGARRCTVAGSMLKCGSPPQSAPPRTPPAMYSSQYLLKQFAESPEIAALRPQTASKAASTAAWRPPLDTQTNANLYERYRRLGNGWPRAVVSAPEVLDVAAEQAAAAVEAISLQQPAAEEGPEATEGGAAFDVTDYTAPVFPPQTPPPPTATAEATAVATPTPTEDEFYVEVTPPKASLFEPEAPLTYMKNSLPKAAAPSAAPPPATRRALRMMDAASFYDQAVQVHFCSAGAHDRTPEDKRATPKRVPKHGSR